MITTILIYLSGYVACFLTLRRNFIHNDGRSQYTVGVRSKIFWMSLLSWLGVWAAFALGRIKCEKIAKW